MNVRRPKRGIFRWIVENPHLKREGNSFEFLPYLYYATSVALRLLSALIQTNTEQRYSIYKPY
jgi:hypothetical protein